jgi:hypothetical protein
MPVLQSTPRRSATKQAALARRLNSARTIAPHILSSTMEYDGGERQVITMQACEPCYIGTLVLEENEYFYLVASKFEGRYYVVQACPEGGHKCSSSDVTVRYRCIEQVKAFVASRKAKKAA